MPEKTVFVVILTALVFAAMSTTALAHEFVAAKTGSTSGKGISTQTFELGGSTVECAEASVSSDVTELKSASLPATVEYAKCTLLGSLEVDVSQTSYSLDASGALSFLSAITLTIPAAKCTVTIPAQSGLEEASYEDSSGNLIAKLNVADLAWSGESESCPGSGSEGQYHGVLSVDSVTWQ
jgi:hypothetical protein